MLDSPLVTIGLPLVNALIMCGIGMTLTPVDFSRVVHAPKAAALGVAGHYLLLPLIGFGFAALFTDRPGYAVGFVLIAACPSANASNVLVYLARGNVALAVSLSAVCAVATLVSIPLLVNIAFAWFGGDGQAVRLPLGRTIGQLAALILVPIATGMLVRRYAPGIARRTEPWIARLSLPFLLLLVVIFTMDNAGFVRDSLRVLGPATLAMCVLAMGSGLLLARAAALPVADAVTIGMEVGVQNGMLAILVALTMLRLPEVAIPGATYSLTMLLPALGLVLFGRRRLSAGRRFSSAS